MLTALVLVALAQEVWKETRLLEPPAHLGSVELVEGARVADVIKARTLYGGLPVEISSNACMWPVEAMSFDVPERSFAVFDDPLNKAGTVLERCGLLLALRPAQKVVAGSDDWDDAPFVPIERVAAFAESGSLVTAVAVSRGAPEEFTRELVARLPLISGVVARRFGTTPLVALSGPASELRPLIPWLHEWSEFEDAAPAAVRTTQPTSADGTRLVVQFDEVNGSPLGDFAKAANAGGCPVRLEPPALATRLVRVVGRIRIDPSELRELVESVARALQLRVYDDGKELTLTDVWVAGREREVPLAELPAWRSRRTQIRVDVPRGRLDREATTKLLSGFLGDPRWESVEAPADTPVIRFVGPAHVVARNVDLLRTCDRP